MSILCTRSFPHLRKGIGARKKIKKNTWFWLIPAHTVCFCSTVFQEFVRFSNKDIEQIIKKEMSGDVKNTFYAIGNNSLTVTMFYNPLEADLSFFVLQFAVLRTNLLILQTAYTKP